MSMIKVGTDAKFRDSGVGIYMYSGSSGCADSSCQKIVTFESPNFKETVNGKTPKAYVEEMQQRIRVDGFSAKVCEAKLTAQGVGATPAKTACAGQREIPDLCGEACPENMECKYDAITTFANTCCEKGGYMCLDKNAAAKQAAANQRGLASREGLTSQSAPTFR